MKTTADKDIEKLNPKFREKVKLFINEVNKNEKLIFIIEGYRSQERQLELLKLGFSQVSHSNHQDGLAIDIGFYGNELYPSDFSKWRLVADIAKKYGIDWGFDLWQWDKPHFQDNGCPILKLINEKMQSKYTDIMNQVCKNNNFEPLFNDHEGTGNLTEQEVKELIEIGFARFWGKLKEKGVING